jgi:transposase-like protein
MEDQKQSIESTEDLSLFCCQNRKCPSFGMRGLGNLKVRGRVGRRKTRQLYCTTCEQRFVETKGTVFYRARMSHEKLTSILQHVQEGNGMRQTGRLMRVKEDTVIRLTRLAGKHAHSVHQQKVAFSPSDPRTATR